MSYPPRIARLPAFDGAFDGPGDWYQVAAGVTHSARFEVATSEIELWFIEP